jgi:hypothetical protein
VVSAALETLAQASCSRLSPSLVSAHHSRGRDA